MVLTTDAPEIFISYASKDVAKVVELAGHLEGAGISIWRDKDQILGGENYGPRIVHAIKSAKVLLVCCSDSSMRSKNVKQEIQLAWHYNVPYLPVMLERVSYPEQVEYWLHGWQYVNLFDDPIEAAMAKILAGLHGKGVGHHTPRPSETIQSAPTRMNQFQNLLALAHFTDQIWPMPSESHLQAGARVRDLGAPQNSLQRNFKLGSSVRLALESERNAQLVLLNKGTSGTLYCLCPSAFAPSQMVKSGLNIFPQAQSPFPAFAVTGNPGQENLFAILSDEPLCQDWGKSRNAQQPARVLSESDIAGLVNQLQVMPPDRWTALATYFSVLPE